MRSIVAAAVLMAVCATESLAGYEINVGFKAGFPHGSRRTDFYRVYVDGSPVGVGKPVADEDGVREAVIELGDVKPDVDVEVYVTAVDDGGFESDKSATITITSAEWDGPLAPEIIFAVPVAP